MKLILSLILIVTPDFSSAQGWRGIIPLHSSRTDVERLLGTSADECKCAYETENEYVRVDYAQAPCEGYLSGWNVPADTVLRFSVRTKRDQMFSDLHLDLSKFSKIIDDAFTAYYASRAEGVEYVVSSSGLVSAIYYIPSAKDLQLRCLCFPAEDGSITRPVHFDDFSVRSLNDALARLDNFAIVLSTGPKYWKGYVIVYARHHTREGETLGYIKRFRNHLVIKRQT